MVTEDRGEIEEKLKKDRKLWSVATCFSYIYRNSKGSWGKKLVKKKPFHKGKQFFFKKKNSGKYGWKLGNIKL